MNENLASHTKTTDYTALIGEIRARKHLQGTFLWPTGVFKEMLFSIPVLVNTTQTRCATVLRRRYALSMRVFHLYQLFRTVCSGRLASERELQCVSID